MRSQLLAHEAFIYRLSGQADDSSGPDALNNYHAIASNVGIACLSVVVSFVAFGAVPITLFSIFELPIWLTPFLVPVAMLFGYVLFYRLRRLGALRERLKIQALGLEEA